MESVGAKSKNVYSVFLCADNVFLCFQIGLKKETSDFCLRFLE